MKGKSVIAMAVAGALWSAGALAGGGYGHSRAMHEGSFEVATPMSVNESAPWLAGTTHGFGSSASAGIDNEFATGASASAGAVGSVGFDSGSSQVSAGIDHEVGTGASASIGGSGSVGFESGSAGGLDLSMSTMPDVEYWRLDQDAGVGATSSAGASGTVGTIDFSPGTTVRESALVSEHFIVPAPLSPSDGWSAVRVEIDPGSTEMLDQLASENAYVLTPIYVPVVISSFENWPHGVAVGTSDRMSEDASS